MNRVKHIEIDLNTFKIDLRFQNTKDPLILHFDTPSRKFYLSLIALIVHEMKQQAHSGYVYIRKHENRLAFLDDALAGSNASGTIDGMWEKIRKAWHYSLPNLEEAAHFKVEGRDHISPFEKGGKYLYECTEDECDIWARLFGIDEITNKWRFRFAVDEAWLGLSDVTLKYGDLQDDSAWDVFLEQLEKTSSKNLTDTDDESKRPAIKTYPIRWQLLAMAVVVMFVLLIGSAAILNRYLRPVPPLVESVAAIKPSIAILPFINVSDDPDKDYFCDGITEELINNLTREKDLRVISRTSAFSFKDKSVDLPTIGQKLGVDHILEGSVRISGNQLRITAMLINMDNDSPLWSDTYDHEMKDIFEIQRNLAEEIACNLKSKLGCVGGVQLAKKYTENIDAYNSYLKGRYFWINKKHNKAIEHFEKAISFDPNYALAYAGLADVYNRLAFFFSKPLKEYYNKARDAANKAIEIDDNLSEGHASLSYFKLHYEWDWKGSERSARRAIELNPGNALAHRYYFSYFKTMGQTAQAFKEIETAIELDPLNRGNMFRLGMLCYVDGQLDRAMDIFKEVLRAVKIDMKS
jgi:adenylate cyclase